MTREHHYGSDVKLGEKYRDEQTGIAGVAVATTFFEHGCQRVSLEWTDESSILNEMPFDAPRLAGESEGGEALESDIVLGERYRDGVTGIEGVAVALTFAQHGCERATLEWAAGGELKEASFDAPRLIGVSTGERATSDKTGGPMRGDSHARRGPAGRSGPLPRSGG